MNPITKSINAPKPNPPSVDFLAVEAEADTLQAELESLRELGYGFPLNTERLERVRELRRQLSKLDAKSRSLFHRDNPEWVKFYGIENAFVSS